MTSNINEFLATLLGITLFMSAVIAVLLLLRKPMKKRFTAGCRFVIWTLVMLRLCVPIGGILLPSIISVSYPNATVTPSAPENTISENKFIANTEQDNTEIANSEITHTPSEQSPSGVPGISDSNRLESEVAIPPSAAPISPEESTSIADSFNFRIVREILSSALFCIWATGFIAFAAVCLVKYNISVCKINRQSTAASTYTDKVYKELCQEMEIVKVPELRISHSVDSPMLYGYFVSKIVMPEIELSDAALKNILSHELTHYSRHDIYIKFISMLGNAIHWFNPFAYIAAKNLATEMELSCDEKVLSGYDDTVRVSYGQVMLDIIKNSRSSSDMLTTRFNPSANAVKERFVNILDSSKKRKGLAIICIILSLCLVSGSILGFEVSAAKDIPTDEATEHEENSALPEDAMVPETEISPEAETEIAKKEDNVKVSTTESADTREETTVPETGADSTINKTNDTAKEIFQEVIPDAVIDKPSPEKSSTTDSGTKPITDNIIRPELPEDSAADTNKKLSENGSYDPMLDFLAGISVKPSSSSKHIHSYASVCIPATCSKDGYIEYTCISCKDSYRTVTYKTDEHNLTFFEERTVWCEGKQITYTAEICQNCGLELGLKGSELSTKNIKYYITGPYFADEVYAPYEENELVVYGTGDMADYAKPATEDLFAKSVDQSLAQWLPYADRYRSIRIGDHITSIGENAFAYCCNYVDEIFIGKSVETIEKNAFRGAAMITLYLPRSIKSIDPEAFTGATGINIKYEGNSTEFAKIDFGNLNNVVNIEYNVQY